jgi:hypothetical protein
MKKLFKSKVLIILWIIDIIWSVLAYYLLVVFPEGNILLKDITMAVGYSVFRIILFIYSGSYIFTHLFFTNEKLIDRVKCGILPIVCYMGDALILKILYKIIA